MAASTSLTPSCSVGPDADDTAPGRMAHETLVHQADAQLAAGAEPEPVIDAEVAADAIDEWLTLLAGGILGSADARTKALPAGAGLHIHSTDAAKAGFRSGSDRLRGQRRGGCLAGKHRVLTTELSLRDQMAAPTAASTSSHTAGIPVSSAERWVRTTTVRSREGRFDHAVPRPPSQVYRPSSSTDSP
jgi:hypothetical protein